MTIQELLALGSRDRDAAWEPLRSALLRGSVWACRKIGLDPAEADDIAQDGLVRAARNDFAALRDAGARVLLSAWARGMAQNLVRERLRARRLVRLGDEPSGRAEPQDDAAPAGWEAVDLLSLTDKEAAAVRERVAGRSDRQAASKLGIGRSTFRDRLKRAVRRLQRAHGELPPLPEMSRNWADEMLDRRPRLLRPRDRKCLLLYASGETRREIGRVLRLSVNGVKCLLRSLKRHHATATPAPAPTAPARTRGPSLGRGGRSSR